MGINLEIHKSRMGAVPSGRNPAGCNSVGAVPYGRNPMGCSPAWAQSRMGAILMGANPLGASPWAHFRVGAITMEPNEMWTKKIVDQMYLLVICFSIIMIIEILKID